MVLVRSEIGFRFVDVAVMFVVVKLLSIRCGRSLPAPRITRVLDAAIEQRVEPRAIRTDNGPEFTSKAFDAWCYERGIEHYFIRPGKPIENAFAEAFNGRVRDELLNQHCFTSVRHAQDLCADWQSDYNSIRPHTALAGLSPEQYLACAAGGHGAAGQGAARVAHPWLS